MTETVIPIVNDVKTLGDSAVIDYTKKFDKCVIDSVLVKQIEIENGYSNTSKEVIFALEKAVENIREFHSKQLKNDFFYTRTDGSLLGFKYHPIDSAAVYVPGGKAAYPSSVLMGIIPAQIAGVSDITLISPPRNEGKIADPVCAACKILGVTNVIKAGGAQGIAAAAFGTETVPKSEIIVGPGNVFVTAAKSYLFSLGVIQIDSLAGISEVLIIADENANPKWTAWDLLAQAEHEENAKAILLTTSEKFAKEVISFIEEDLSSGRGRSNIKHESITNHALILISETIEEAIDFSNKYAPEHLQVMVKNPNLYLDKIKNAGSVFLGEYSPVPIGDYFSGTNHILPVGGAARFSSGLSVDSFMRRMTFQNISKEGLRNSKEFVHAISKVEGFDDKHGGAVNIRFLD
ncbi:MAG: histidinol dehydrogenase [Spirochaetes bacterium]|nr:histidinol dehydrogenase [Spirochaetota bacterium]